MENKTRKTDRRTLYTRRVIREAFIEHLRCKPWDKITVTDICKSAQINRTTFYLHYVDALAVFEELVDEIIADITDYLKNIETALEYWAQTEAFYQSVMKDDVKVLIMYKAISCPLFHEKIAQAMADVMMAPLAGTCELEPEDLRLILTALHYAYLSADTYFLKTHSIKELERCNALLNKFVVDPCYRALKIMPKPDK